MAAACEKPPHGRPMAWILREISLCRETEMRRLLCALLIVVALLAGCGGGGDNSGGFGGGAGGPAAGGGDLPAGSTVIFGTSFDPTSLAVTGKAISLQTGTPMVAVGRAFTPRPASEVTVVVGSGSSNFPAAPVTASNTPDSADLFAYDLTPLKLTPGTWVVEFRGASGRTVASGS